MDIQVSSNFERLLFERLGRDAAPRARADGGAASQSGGFTIPHDALAAIRAEFDAMRARRRNARAEMARVWRESEVLLDPHTAVGVHAARAALTRDPRTPVDRAGDRPSRQIPRRGGEGDRRAPAAARRISPTCMASPSASRVCPTTPSAVADYLTPHARPRA